MSHVKQMIKKQKKSLVFLLLFAVLTAAAIAAQAYFLAAVIDGVFLQGKSFEALIPLLAGLLIVFLIRALSGYGIGVTGVAMGVNAKREFRHTLLKKLSENPIQASLHSQSGKKTSLLLDIVDEVDSYFSGYIPQIIQSSIIPLALLIVIFTQHVNTGIIILITAPFIPLFMVIIGMQTKKKSEEQLDKLSAFSGQFLDVVQGLVTLKLFGQAKKKKESIRDSSLQFRDATMEILKVAFASSFMLELISMLAIGIVALEIALQLIIFDGISFFTAFFVLLLAPEFYSSFKELGTAFHNGRSSMGAVSKITEELEKEDQPVTWGQEKLASGQPPEIKLVNLTFQYGEAQFALSKINAHLKPFSKVAIAGKSGSGKSTLLHLLAGLLPPRDGSVVVDGKDLSDYREQEWFDQLSYISQNPYLFSGTIAENIAIGKTGEVTRKEVEEAAEKAGLTEMIASLENGYETLVGEAGRGLSGGEKQRVALARAFIKKPSIILFDEPTTGLDLKTEKVLQASIKKLSEGATVITVAHRLHTIKDADQILFLEDGKQMAAGTHEELLRSVPEYRKMVSVQKGVRV
ncbi:thiol reductant ABC exporter subunit CydD [Virgibacillus sp. YIM 98842]|uniref:thiol reductant ABC exporter subunit CydD n=1 Tax=Virgibacillus sp. YIM 98842 TaxID=2663533 RepID=UPI0013D9E8FB|nr:thiol reductant ABC exporter subunit CydD [Virgibacillus sp. YIM 98842]